MRLGLSYFAIAISVICGVMVFVLFKVYPREALNVGERWAVLILDEAHEDRRIRESLAGIGAFISESSQNIFIDDFGSVKKIPLDSYYDEIEAFDPRNDGYAEKLSAFFVRDGKRFFFLPLENTFTNPSGKLKKQLSSLLPDMVFSFAVLGKARSVLPEFLLLALACALALYLSRDRRLFILVLPVLLALAWGGASSVFLAAIMAGIWALLREPLGELSAARSYRLCEPGYAYSGAMDLKERLRPYRINLSLAGIFLILFFAVAIIGEHSLIPVAFALASFFLLYFLSLECECRRALELGHTLFRPIPMFPPGIKVLSLFPFMWPFIAASGLAALLAFALPSVYGPAFPSGEKYSFIDPDYFVSSEDYKRHVSFQKSFSFQSLDYHGSENHSYFPEPSPKEYLRYYLGEDGLIDRSVDFSGEYRDSEDPGFPLEKLMDFLIQY